MVVELPTQIALSGPASTGVVRLRFKGMGSTKSVMLAVGDCEVLVTTHSVEILPAQPVETSR